MAEQPACERDQRLIPLLDGTPYELVRFLGRGGMGDVYVVRHSLLGSHFAFKVLHEHFTKLPGFAERMRVEAEALGRLNHPNVVDVIDFWIADNGRPCLVMELLRGRALSAELDDRGKLAAAEAVAITAQTLSALGRAHQSGIVHRDIKPENLYLHEIPSYQQRQVKVLDFGLARGLPDVSHLAPAPLAVPTASGAVVGSPRFLSPEARRGERVDHREDLYAVGVVLYLMLTGFGPFDIGPGPPAPASWHYAADGTHGVAPTAPGPTIGDTEPLGTTALNTASVDASDLYATPLDKVVLRAIHPNPIARFQTAEEFAEELRRAF